MALFDASNPPVELHDGDVVNIPCKAKLLPNGQLQLETTFSEPNTFLHSTLIRNIASTQVVKVVS